MEQVSLSSFENTCTSPFQPPIPLLILSQAHTHQESIHTYLDGRPRQAPAPLRRQRLGRLEGVGPAVLDVVGLSCFRAFTANMGRLDGCIHGPLFPARISRPPQDTHNSSLPHPAPPSPILRRTAPCSRRTPPRPPPLQQSLLVTRCVCCVYMR